jgi:uncharacterized membrane protein
MNNNEQSEKDKAEAGMTALVERNIRTLVNQRIKEEKQKPLEERIAEAVGRFTGNMAFVYTHAAIFGVWIGCNLGWFGLKPFDPSFTALQLVTAIEAIFLTTFVLMSQNSLDSQADKRADLDLQISLLAEHEITRLISLVNGIAKKLEVEEAKNPEIDQLAKDLTPEKLMETMENEQEKSMKEARYRCKD